MTRSTGSLSDRSSGRGGRSGPWDFAARGTRPLVWQGAAGGEASKNFNADQQQMHADARGWDWGERIGTARQARSCGFWRSRASRTLADLRASACICC
jgi:hypothetical protein